MNESHLRNELQSILHPPLVDSSNELTYRSTNESPSPRIPPVTSPRIPSIARKVVLLILLVLVGLLVTNLDRCMSYVTNVGRRPKKDESSGHDDPLFQRFD